MIDPTAREARAVHDQVVDRVKVALAELPASNEAKEWLPIAVARIVERFSPQRVILFGSQASGLPRVDSDVDLLIVADEIDDRQALTVAILRELRDLPIAKDVLVVAWGGDQAPDGSMVAEALRKGIVLYEVGP